MVHADPPIQPHAFARSYRLKSVYYVVGFGGVFHDKRSEDLIKKSLLEPLTGNFNSLMSSENSLLFSKPAGPEDRVKRRELCSMLRAPTREEGPISRDFPVKFPVSREMHRESGSLETACTAINPFQDVLDNPRFATIPR
jgi:hypothetical protein